MPPKCDAFQGEVAAITHREARRSDSMIGNAKFAQASSSTRTIRPSAHVSSENVGIATGARRSPRVGISSTCTTSSRLARTSGGPRVSGALSDITNVTSIWTGAGQAYGKSGKPNIASAAPAPLPERAAQPAAVQAPVASARQLTARGSGDSSVPVPVPVLGNAISSLPTSVAEITSNPFQGDADNAQSAHEYAGEIYSKLFSDEASYLPRINYMESQTDINGKMRAILIDWLVEVHMKYRLRNETLFLTVNLIDRYLGKAHVMRKKLQLVGVVAMFIAAKFEEINPPEVQDFVHITDNAYTKDELLLMECTMLTALNFEIVVPTASNFLDRLSKVNNCDDEHREAASYIIELGLLDMRMLCYPPSHIVSASLLVSNELLGKRPAWPQLMAQHSHYSEQELRVCADECRELLDGAPKNQLQAVRKKFLTPQRHSVARMAF